MSKPKSFGSTHRMNMPAPLHRKSLSSNSHFLSSYNRAYNGDQTTMSSQRAHPSGLWSRRNPAHEPTGHSPNGQKRPQFRYQPQQQRHFRNITPQPQFVRLQTQPHTRTASGGATPVSSPVPLQKYEDHISSPMAVENASHPRSYSGSTQSMRITGVVHSLKHSYGFVKCDNTGARVFFHFSELDQESIAALPSLGIDQPPVQIGDRVIFERVRDSSSGREKATAVQVLQRSPFGYVAPIFDHFHNKTMSSDTLPHSFPVPYSSGMLKDPSPELPDDVNERSENHGVHDDSASREVGVIVSTKHSYGFIKCAEREHKQVFFHFSEFLDDHSLIVPGAEIQFTISPNQSGKVVATRIRLLPAGSVQFATIEHDTITGVIKSGVENQQSTSQKTRRKARPSSMDVGTLVVPAEELQQTEIDNGHQDHERTLTFSGADLKFPGIALMEGDEVQFRVKLDRRTRARTATEILLVRPAANGRQRGIVTIWKDLYGFLKCDGRKDHLFFHLNEFIDKAHHPQVGDELEFNIALDNRGQDNAIRVSVLPKGSVKLQDDRIFGVVLSCPPVFSMPTTRRTDSEMSITSSTPMSYGIIRIFAVKDENGTPVQLTEGELALLKPLPADMPMSGGIVSPIAEEKSISPKASSPHQVSHKSAMTSWCSPPFADGVADGSPMESVRFTLADPDTPFRAGDIISLAVAPAPKFLRASNICFVPKVGEIEEVGSAHAAVRVAATAFSSEENITLRLHDLPADFGVLNAGDAVEVIEVTNGSCPRSARYAKSVRRLIQPTIMDQLKKLVPELNESYHPKTRPPCVANGHSSEKSGTEMLEKPTHTRWDSRLEPRTWT